MNKNLPQILATENWHLDGFLDLNQFTNPESHERRDSQIPFQNNLVHYQKVIHQSFSYPSPKGPRAFCQDNHTLQKRKWSGIWGTIGYWFWTNTNSRQYETSLWSSSKRRNPWRLGNLQSFSQGSTLSRSSRSSNPSCCQFPSCIIRTDTFSTWQNFHIGCLLCGVRAITAGRAKWKPLELHLSAKTVNQKQFHVPRGTVEISATISTGVVDLKDAGMLVPAPFNSMACAEDSWILENDSGLPQA